MLAHAHHVFGPRVPDDGVEAVRLPLADGARGNQALGEPFRRIAHRLGVERDDDVLRVDDVLELHSRSLRSGTTSAGRFITLIPAPSSAAIFFAAVPQEPEMIAPACPMRPPGGAVCPAMNPTTGFVTPCFTNSAACCSSVPPISPI